MAIGVGRSQCSFVFSSVMSYNFYAILCAICTVALFGGQLGEAYSGLIPPDPEHPDKCIYRGDTLKPGVNPGVAPCQRLTCNDDGSILIEGCGRLHIENCNRGERINTDKAYPECCKLKYKCEHEDGTPYFIEKDVSDGGLQKEQHLQNNTIDANKTENSA